MPKILVIDIETRPALSYHWRMFKENIGTDQVKEPGGILCVGMKWIGKREMFLFNEWEHGTKGMLEAVRDFIQEADMMVTKNGEKFDIPWLRKEFLKHRVRPPAPTTHIDLQKVMKKEFKFLSNRLDYVAQELGIGKKVKHEGFPLWIKVMEGNEVARRKMLRYCAGDVRITDRMYRRFIPFITNHPHMGFEPKRHCGACGSDHVHVSKYRRTRTMVIQQLHCQTCGSYFDGVRKKVS